MHNDISQQKIILSYQDAQHVIVLISIYMLLQLLVCIQKRSFMHTFVHVCSCIRFTATVPAVITNLIFLCHVGLIQNKVSLLCDPVMVIWNFLWRPTNVSQNTRMLLPEIKFNNVSSLTKINKKKSCEKSI